MNMKQSRRTAALLLCLTMLLSIVVCGAGAHASGQNETPPTQAMQECIQLGLLSGLPDGSLRPESPVTRAQMCKMVWLAWSGNRAPATGVSSAFLDGNGHWAQSFLVACHRQRFVNGIGGGRFAPDAPVTPMEGAKMLLTTLGYDAARESLTGADWAANTASLARQADLLKGVDTTQPALTRAEAAQLLWNGLHASQVTYVPSDQASPTKKLVRQEGPSLWEVNFSPRASEAGKATLQAIAQKIGSERMDEIVSGQTPETLDDLTIRQLNDLVSALAALPAKDVAESDAINALMDQVNKLLFIRLPMDTTPVTPALLLQFVNERILTCEKLIAMDVIDPDSLDKDAATMTPVEVRAQCRALLEKLRPFCAAVQEKATQDNAYQYWCIYWDKILEQAQPARYVPR